MRGGGRLQWANIYDYISQYLTKSMYQEIGNRICGPVGGDRPAHILPVT